MKNPSNDRLHLKNDTELMETFHSIGAEIFCKCPYIDRFQLNNVWSDAMEFLENSMIHNPRLTGLDTEGKKEVLLDDLCRYMRHHCPDVWYTTLNWFSDVEDALGLFKEDQPEDIPSDKK